MTRLKICLTRFCNIWYCCKWHVSSLNDKCLKFLTRFLIFDYILDVRNMFEIQFLIKLKFSLNCTD